MSPAADDVNLLHPAGPGTAGAAQADEMPDVFVSYARTNRPVAEQLAQALTASGLKVWWDSDLSAGAEFAAVIEAKLQGAAVVIVLWSADSVHSSFVRDECSRAVRHNKLVPVRIEPVDLPLGFGQLHTLDLLDWDGDTDDAAFQKLLQDVLHGQKHPPEEALVHAASPTSPMPARWRLRGPALAAVVAVTVSAGGVAAWFANDAQERRSATQAEAQRRIDADKTQADRHFSEGLEHQYAAVPQLEKALNEYLSAIQLRPAHARAHYYLGHVYAQSGKPVDALAAFKTSLALAEAPLDRSQRLEADKQVLALAAVPGEDLPITRAGPVAAAVPLPSAAPDTSVASASVPPELQDMVRPRGILLPSPVPKTPPPSAPPEASVAQLVKSVEGLFDDNKERRISATTSLVLDPQALSDAVPLAISRALPLARRGPAGLDAGDSSGIVNTLVLLQSALPGTLQVNRQAITQLLDAAEPLGDYTGLQARKVRELLKAAATRNPVAYIQIANEAQRPIAEALSRRLRTFGYEAPGIEMVGDRAPLQAQVRVQGKSDRSYARWVAKVVAEVADVETRTQALHNARPNTDTFEIWFDRSLCAPQGRQLAGCKAG
jgi:tetratricopeptide (TPR) repeat protein